MAFLSIRSMHRYKRLTKQTPCKICKNVGSTNSFFGTICVECNNIICNRSWCSLKLDQKKNDKRCKSCVIIGEYSMIKDSIYDSTNHYLNNDHVISVITEYAVGIIVNCCYCETETIYSNIFDFLSIKTDINGNKTNSYSVNDDYLTSTNIARYVYGKYWRIFCNKCTKLMNSACFACGTFDMNIDMGYSMYCMNHPFCIVCKRICLNQIKTCKVCANNICKNTDCSSKNGTCTNCSNSMIDMEYKHLLNAVNDALILIDGITFYIIQIIVDYGIGISVECCLCNDDILFDNTTSLQLLSCDYMKREIHHYKIELKYLLISCMDKYRYICNEYQRIFCHKCVGNIYKCQDALCEYRGYNHRDVFAKHCMNHALCLSHYNCIDCTTMTQKENIVTVLFKEIGNVFNLRLILIIAEYGIGYTLPCCNYTVCDNEITFDNQIMFDKYKDYQNNDVYYYEPDPAVNIFGHFIYNKFVRLFCGKCKGLKKCQHKQFGGCDKKDVLFEEVIANDDHLSIGNVFICFAHPCCYVCGKGKGYKLNQCSQCNNFVCLDYTTLCSIDSVCRNCIM